MHMNPSQHYSVELLTKKLRILGCPSVHAFAFSELSKIDQQVYRQKVFFNQIASRKVKMLDVRQRTTRIKSDCIHRFLPGQLAFAKIDKN